MPHDYTIHNIDLNLSLQVLLSKVFYSHDGAGVTSLLAALADQKRSRSFALKHLLCLRPAQLTNKPVSLILMRQILLVSLQHVCAANNRSGVVMLL